MGLKGVGVMELGRNGWGVKVAGREGLGERRQGEMERVGLIGWGLMGLG